MTLYRLVIYDSPEHSLAFIGERIAPLLGLEPEEGVRRLGRAHFDGRVELPMPDRAQAEATMEGILAAGPDPELPNSRGSLVVSLERTDETEPVVIRRGRTIAGEFVAMDQSAVEEFLGASLDDYELDTSTYRPGWPSGKPLLVIPGRHQWLSVALLGALPLAFSGAAIALSSGAWPWLYPGRGAPSPFALIFVFVLSGVPLIWLALFLRPRSNRVELHEKHVLLGSFPSGRCAEWKRLRAYRDGSADYVQLLLPGDLVGDPSWAIPTRDETTRALVLAMLVKHGVPREE